MSEHTVLVLEVLHQARRIQRVRALCLDNMVEAVDGSMTDADTLWPSEVLSILDEEKS